MLCSSSKALELHLDCAAVVTEQAQCFLSAMLPSQEVSPVLCAGPNALSVLVLAQLANLRCACLG